MAKAQALTCVRVGEQGLPYMTPALSSLSLQQPGLTLVGTALPSSGRSREASQALGAARRKGQGETTVGARRRISWDRRARESFPEHTVLPRSMAVLSDGASPPAGPRPARHGIVWTKA